MVKAKHDLQILTVNLPFSILNFLDKLIENKLIESRSQWIREAVEMYFFLFAEAQTELDKLPPIFDVPAKTFEVVRHEMINKVEEINHIALKDLAIRKYRYKRHIPLGNIFHPEIDYSSPHYITPEVEQK